MNLAAPFLFYVCCILCFTVTFCEVYISTSKSLIEEGDTFEINCTVRPLSSAVQFLLDGNAKGDCTAPVTGIAPGTCSVGITQNINTDETTLTIASASVATNQGTWKCTHNTESAEIAVDIFKFITVLTNNQYELPATIETSSSPNLEFKVFVACGNPQPIITWILDTCDGSQTGIAVNSPTLTTNTSAGCTSPLVAYTSAIKASALASPTVEICYIPKATMTYNEKPSVMPSSQFTSQVQFPGKSPDSPKSNLGPIIGATAATVLVIVLIVIIVYKKYYRKDHRSESLDGMIEVETATHSVLPVGTGNQFVEPSHKTPVGTGNQFVEPSHKTPVGTGNQFVEPSHKTPVGTGTQLLQPVPKVLSQIDYHKGMPLEPEGPLKIKTRQGHVEFQWKPPKSDGGSEITEYIVEVNGIKFDTWETFATSASMKLKVPMEKFKDGKVMSFRVRAGNENGLSEPLLAQKPFTLQNSHDLLANRPVVTNQGRGHEGFLPRNSVGTEHKGSSLLEQVPIDRTLPKPV